MMRGFNQAANFGPQPNNVFKGGRAKRARP
jgi:hypothetical protein